MLSSMNSYSSTFTPSNDTQQVHQHINPKFIPAKGPIPYGSIPKFNTSKRSKKVADTNNSIIDEKSELKPNISAPYPYFSLTEESSFFSYFSNIFSNQSQETSGPVGFMPSSPITTEAQTSQLEVTVPVSSPIDCYYDDGGDASYQDNSSYLSSSSSSEESEASLSSFVPSNSSSCPTNNSFSSSYTSFNIMNEDNIREHVRNSLTSNSISTAALSDILCDHYVQTQTMDDPFSPSSSTTSDDNAIDVPLETFRIFEGPSHAFDDWFIGQPPLLDDNKEWTLVETTSKPTRYLPKQEDDDDEGEDPSTTTTKKDKRQSRSSSVKTDSTRTPLFYTRDTRANTDYLRMIVAEVNMMRAQKIVGPLRPRRVLPKRTDRFMFRPSPLQLVLV